MYKKFNKSLISKIDSKGFLARARLLNTDRDNRDNKDNRYSNNSNDINNINSIIEIPTFNILVATIGRNSLDTLIESLSDQLTERDCITIVFDNNTIRPLKIIEKLKCKIIIYNEYAKLGYWGHGIRNKYARRLEYKDFILHADDDDTYFPNAFNKLRQFCICRDILYIAKIIQKDRRIIPQNNKIKLGNISTQCGIIPYRYNMEGIWGNFYGGDASYYLQIIRKFARVSILNIYIYNYGNTEENLEYFKSLV
jgi:hypothetical protein